MNSKLTLAQRVNILRASVMGANDGIISVAGIVVGVAGASASNYGIFISGIAGMLAGTVSMAMGEYVSVSTQKDAEKAAVAKEKQLLKTDFSSELATVKMFYVERGVSEQTAALIAQDLMAKKPLETVISIKYNLNLGQYMNPWNAALSSLVSASIGGIFPLAAMTLSPVQYQWPLTILAVCVSVALTGYLSAKLGNGMVKTAILRNLIVGIITMIIHYTVGIML